MNRVGSGARRFQTGPRGGGGRALTARGRPVGPQRQVCGDASLVFVIAIDLIETTSRAPQGDTF